jgi:hypothetical protein
VLLLMNAWGELNEKLGKHVGREQKSGVDGAGAAASTARARRRRRRRRRRTLSRSAPPSFGGTLKGSINPISLRICSRHVEEHHGHRVHLQGARGRARAKKGGTTIFFFSASASRRPTTDRLPRPCARLVKFVSLSMCVREVSC